MLRIEHVAYQVADPIAFTAWYCDNLDFTIKRAGGEPTYTHFLADGSGKVMVEVYSNPAIDVPDYVNQHHLTLHTAFVCDDVKGTVDALVAAGATIADPITKTPSGDVLAMLKDPWGMSIQLCHRANPMV